MRSADRRDLGRVGDDGELLLDLAYEEDSRAEVDMNVAMTGAGEFVEVQGTAEARPFSARAARRDARPRRERDSGAVRRAAGGDRDRELPILTVSRERLQALVAEVGEFRIRDRALTEAQRRMEAIVREREPSGEELRRYLSDVERYFGAFAAEARRNLADLDRRIAHQNQVLFNLQAERGVALRRVERTQGVLSGVEEIADR